MGNICTNNFEKQDNTETVDTYKNCVQMQVTLGSFCTVDLVLGHYKQHRSESILVITELKNIQHCDPLRDYTNDSEKTIEIITNMRKTFCKPMVNKICPYKKMFVCVLPNYESRDSKEYLQQYRNLIKEAIQGTKQMTVEFLNTIQGIHSLPNQMLISLLLQELGQLKTVFRLHLITIDKKMMNMYKYELMKTEICSLGG